jgi:hypothetical protein
MEVKITMLKEINQNQKDNYHIFFSHVESNKRRNGSKRRSIMDVEGNSE